MRGREREWGSVLGLLRGGDRGTGGVLLIDGERGVGKTLLLDEAAKAAADRGFTLATGAADELSQLVPMAPLLAAVQESPVTLPGNGPFTGPFDSRIWMIQEIAERLETRARNGPLLVTIDDLQWADPATPPALRTLTRQLISYPLVWILSRSTGEHRNGAERLFALLERDGASLISIGSLADAAIAQITADTLGATPDLQVLDMAASAAGNPFLLIELLTGLVDEGAIDVSTGQARLVSARLPRRIQTTVHDRLRGLSEQTRQLLETAAVLGATFTVEDLAEMLGNPAACLLPQIEEALEAGVLVAATDTFAFRNELFWKAIGEGLPAPIRLALHRQYGEMLVARGGSALPAAVHLLKGARRGDARALAGLDHAAAEVIASAPQIAAELSGRALELTAPSAPDRLARTMTTIDALTAAGRLEEATALVRGALTDQPIPTPETAGLRCALSTILAMGGWAADAYTEAGAVLAGSGLAADVRDDAELALLYALAGMHDNERAADHAESILAVPDRHAAELQTGAHLVLSMIRWDQGRLTDGLSQAREAVRLARGASVPVRRLHPRMTLAAFLTDIHEHEEARRLIGEAADEIDALGQVAWAAGPPVLRARMALAEGRLDDTAADAQAGLGIAAAVETHLFSSAAASALATIALRRGDLRAAMTHLSDVGNTLAHYMATYAEDQTTLVAAQVAEAAEGPAIAVEMAAEIYTHVLERRWVLITNGAAAPWLVRVALAAGAVDRARHVTETMDEIARTNPDFPTVAASAAHARGILDDDPDRLRLACEKHRDPWARASAAEDLGALRARDGDRKQAIDALELSIVGYSDSDATRDVARVRRRLRRLGVRHRHWKSPKRPVAGWESLTETEGAISDLVSQGLTNQQIADRTYVSVHTVAFHLRQVFRKLHIGSRVELTRLAIERSRPAVLPP
jgi:DNA-binding CsgD family transcriptional regulator